MRRFSVFVSSTYENLKDERKEAVQAILEANCIPMGMELFPASSQEQWEFIKNVIDDCDLYLVVIAGKYGSIGTDDAGKKISYTEMEFDYAQKNNKPILTFYHNDISSIISEKTESAESGRKSLAKFTQKAKNCRLAKSWGNKENLKYEILHSINSIKGEILTGGWIKLGAAEDGIAQLKSANDLGLVAAFDKRSIAIGTEYDSRILKAQEGVDIIGFCLSSFLDDHYDQFEAWAKRFPIRILLIDPDFPPNETFADIRDLEERNSIGTIKTGVNRFLTTTHNLWSTSSINFNVKLSTTIPSINMFRIDDEIFWGPYLVDSAYKINPLKSRNLPTLLVKKGGIMFPRLIEHFDAIWNDSTKSRNP